MVSLYWHWGAVESLEPQLQLQLLCGKKAWKHSQKDPKELIQDFTKSYNFSEEVVYLIILFLWDDEMHEDI